MNKLCLAVCFFVMFFDLSAQDIIYKRSGDTICVQVLEISNRIIKYKSMENPDDPIRSISTYDVYSIKYKDGKEEHFKSKRANRDRFFFDHRDTYYYSVALGFGQSYGGLGLRFQGRIGRTLGVGYHGGLGMFLPLRGYGVSTLGVVFFSVGAKFFWYRAWYLDVQYGSVGRYQTGSGSATVYGPSFLIGGDWFFNDRVGLNVAAGVAINATVKYEQLAAPTFDLGFLFKF
jgi:hypothetical protein